MDVVDCVVIGAGVIGLAVARELALAGREVVIIESGAMIGSGVSSRNSEVIHAGLYYPQGSLKAQLCISGKELLYQYCETRRVPYRRCGKLIAATSAAQHEVLMEICANASASGVGDVQHLTAEEARMLEPALRCTAALISPSTGIVDSHAFMHQLLADAQAYGAAIAFNSTVEAGCSTGAAIAMRVRSGDERTDIAARQVVNAAGLYACQVASSLCGSQPVPDAVFAKGSYFSIAKRVPFTRLIYPVPEPGGLGVHLTLDLGGQARFGPDVEWLNVTNADDIDFDVDARRADGFYSQIRRYWPDLPDHSLQPSYSGVRPKVSAEKNADFVIQDAASLGVPGLVNLLGIESPGLTASLAIARNVRQLLKNYA